MFDIEREIRDTKIRLCLDCGKCTVVCPIAQHDPEFNPRLIAQRRISQNGLDPSDETIWECLSCYMCVERCNYRVKFPEFIHGLRAEALAGGAQLQCTHGGALQALQHLMSREDMQQDRLNWLPPDINLTDQSDTIFFVGCAPYFDIVFSELEVNTLEGVEGALRLLNHAQVPFDILANERCCGRDLLLQGDREGFLSLARANMEEFERRGVKKIITNCPECYYTLKVDYPKLRGDHEIEVVHLTEVVAPLLQGGELSLGKLEQRVTYHDPCTLGRCSRIFDEPRGILAAIEGLEAVEMEQNREKALCCGASPWVYCGAVNREIQEKRLAQAETAGAEILVTSCPKCQIHLRCAQRSGDGSVRRIKIEDLASLAARSLDLGGEAIG
ncbi:(Fe-S)-binding protein [Chloroflexota bacterium]